MFNILFKKENKNAIVEKTKELNVNKEEIIDNSFEQDDEWIYCYKVLTADFKSLYYNFQYELNKEYYDEKGFYGGSKEYCENTYLYYEDISILSKEGKVDYNSFFKNSGYSDSRIAYHPCLLDNKTRLQVSTRYLVKIALSKKDIISISEDVVIDKRIKILDTIKDIETKTSNIDLEVIIEDVRTIEDKNIKIKYRIEYAESKLMMLDDNIFFKVTDIINKDTIREKIKERIDIINLQYESWNRIKNIKSIKSFKLQY